MTIITTHAVDQITAKANQAILRDLYFTSCFNGFAIAGNDGDGHRCCHEKHDKAYLFHKLIFSVLFFKLSLLFEKSGAEYPTCQQADKAGDVDDLPGMI